MILEAPESSENWLCRRQNPTKKICPHHVGERTGNPRNNRKDRMNVEDGKQEIVEYVTRSSCSDLRNRSLFQKLFIGFSHLRKRLPSVKVRI
ncbi:hypothetical protein KIN20_005527 [Parelaphostrongylus tenuis]|uniref:Uncharacterized protein n=1 Tax=Parelaphostrongylus tenuis TaxID=148309 RepID=A0AAD5MJ12_PARTN|nr:hypothetical protein KIN20_005527 [Parelaphostrongylus tenuis]